MQVHGLNIPEALCRLIESGVWPNGSKPNEIGRQELHPVLGADAAHVLSSIDDHIVMMPPPFHTIADEVVGGNDFWNTWLTNVGEIDYEKAVIIADSGLGSDSPIILYYKDAHDPVVMYLRWPAGADVQHVWVKTQESFAEFAVAVGLASA